jgi:hypothetical protein
MKLLLPVLIILLVAGCAPTLKLEHHGSSNALIADSDFPHTVAILPFTNETTEPGLEQVVRSAFANQFSAKSYHDLKLTMVDEKLTRFRQAHSGTVATDDPRALAQALGCDGLLFGRVTGFTWVYAGVYSQLGVEAEVWLINVKTGTEIFRLKKAVRYHEGGVPTNPLTAVITAVSTALNLRDIQRVRMVNELAHEFMAEIPAPTSSTVDAAPVIREVLSNAVEGPFGRKRVIKVALQGEPGLVASFDLGAFKKGLPMTEREAGIYSGEYAILPGDMAQDLPVSMTLARPGGRETTWIDPGGYVTIDTEPPPPVTGLKAKGYADRVELTWEGLGNVPDLKGYRVVRSESPLSGYVTLGEVETLLFGDTTAAPGVVYYYRIVPLDRAGNEPEVGDQVRGVRSGGEPLVLAGEIHNNLTFDGDVFIKETVTVPHGVNLVVVDGARLRFAPGTGLIVKGGLFVRSAETFVEFIPQTTETWAGITLEGGRAELGHFKLSGAVTGITVVDTEGSLTGGVITGCATGLLLKGSVSLDVRDLTVSENITGIRLAASTAKITGSAIIRNDNGIVADGFSGELRDNTIRDNSRNIVSESPLVVGPNWFGSTRSSELGISPAVTVELVYDASLPGGKQIAPRDDSFRGLSSEERQRRSVELIIEAGGFFRQANYGKAATLFEQARLASPSAEGFYYLSLCHQQMHETDKALAQLKEGVVAFPQDALLWKSLGILLTEQEQNDDARQALDEALRLSPEDRQARFFRDRLGPKDR